MYFNSQPHKEADYYQYISYIHTYYFNSQPHKEADIPQSYIDTLDGLFQLTASQGG